MSADSEWMKVLEEVHPVNISRAGIVNDSPEKRKIISLLDNVLACYKEINSLLKFSTKADYLFESRIIYGAMKKDVSSAMYHVKLQKNWVITEQDMGRI